MERRVCVTIAATLPLRIERLVHRLDPILGNCFDVYTDVSRVTGHGDLSSREKLKSDVAAPVDMNVIGHGVPVLVDEVERLSGLDVVDFHGGSC